MWGRLNGGPLKAAQERPQLRSVMIVHLIFGGTSTMDCHRLDFLDILFMIHNPGKVFSFEWSSAVFHGLAVGLPCSEFKGFFELFLSFHIKESNTSQGRHQPMKIWVQIRGQKQVFPLKKKTSSSDKKHPFCYLFFGGSASMPKFYKSKNNEKKGFCPKSCVFLSKSSTKSSCKPGKMFAIQTLTFTQEKKLAKRIGI